MGSVPRALIAFSPSKTPTCPNHAPNQNSADFKLPRLSVTFDPRLKPKGFSNLIPSPLICRNVHCWILSRALRLALSHDQGRIWDFHGGGGGGGGEKDYVRARTLRARSPKSLMAGVQGPLKGIGISGVLDAFSCCCTVSEPYF